MRVTSCKSCGAPIFWAITMKDKNVPVDLDPVPFGGNVEILDLTANTPRCRVIRKGETVEADTPRFKFHFVTCPNAKDHRKPTTATFAAGSGE